MNRLNLPLIGTVTNISAVCDKLDQNKSMFKKRYYRQDCRLEFQSYTKVILKIILKLLHKEISFNIKFKQIIKDLHQVNRDLGSVFILDNSPGAYRHYTENAIPIKSWFSVSVLVSKISYLIEIRQKKSRKNNHEIRSKIIPEKIIPK